VAANRESVRDEIATGLGTVLVGTGLPAAQVLNHKAGKNDMAAGTPLVAVLSAGSTRTRMTGQGVRSTFKFEIHTLVLSVSDDSSTWTEANAEDRLDLIDKTVADWFESNPKGTNYGYAALDESSIDEVAVGGESYLLEVTPVTVEVYG